MISQNGYRLKVENIGQLSSFLEDFRAIAMRQLINSYGSMVAIKACEIIDGHRMGVVEISENPLLDACDIIKRQLGRNSKGLFAPSLNCSLKLFFVKEAILASFTFGNDEHLKQWEGMKEVIKWNWHPKMLTLLNDRNERTIRAREYYWKCAMENKHGSHLNFLLIDKPLPNLQWKSIWRHVPNRDARIKNVLSLIKTSQVAGIMSRYNDDKLTHMISYSIFQNLQKVHFEDVTYLKKAASKGSTIIRDEIKKEKKITAEREKKLTAPIIKKEDDGKVMFIDHADVVLGANNQLFLAVPYVGFKENVRVYVEVTDDSITFTQNSVQFGFVNTINRSGIDLLRANFPVTVVEVLNHGGRRSLKAKHRVIITDNSLISSLTNFTLKLNKKEFVNSSQEIEEWANK